MGGYQMTNQRTRGYLLAFVGFAGFALIMVSTPWGIGVNHDSVYYLNSAENVLAGAELSWQAEGGELKPLTHYPPLYPIILVLAGSLGFDLVDAARFLSAVLFGANLIGIAWLIDRYARNRWMAWVACCLGFISPILLDVHLMALTEPLFMLFMLISFAFILEFLTHKTKRWIYLAAVASALASLTRYAGLSLVATCALAILFLWNADRRKRLLYAGTFLLVSLAPFFVWNVRNQFLTGAGVGRALRVHTIPVVKLKLGAETMTRWVVPEQAHFRIGVVLFSLVILGAGIIMGRQIASGKQKAGGWIENVHAKLSLVSILYVLVYGLFLFFSLTFVDASTPLDERILSPAYLMAFIAFFATLSGVDWGESTKILERGLMIGLWIAMLLSYGWRSTGILKTMREEGRGFTARKWSTSELIVKVNEMREDALIYTSDALRLSYLTGRSVYNIPQKLDPVQDTAIESYQDDLLQMRERQRNPGAALVLFSDSFALYRPELPKIEEVTEGLRLFWSTRHGVIYIDPGNAEP